MVGRDGTFNPVEEVNGCGIGEEGKLPASRREGYGRDDLVLRVALKDRNEGPVRGPPDVHDSALVLLRAGKLNMLLWIKLTSRRW